MEKEKKIDMGQEIRYEIKHNQVREVEKYNDKEERITSEGIDSLGNTIYIKNLDSGKSKELMRVVLEGDYEEGGSRKKLFIVLLVAGFLVGLLIYFIFYSDNGENKKIPENISNSLGLPGSGSESKNIINKEAIKPVIAESKTEKIDISLELQTLKLENNKLSFDYESLRLELLREIEKNGVLITENVGLKGKNKDLALEIETLQVESIENVQNSPSKDFMLYLGQSVYESCEKVETGGGNNGCKDLYYKFLKKY